MRRWPTPKGRVRPRLAPGQLSKVEERYSSYLTLRKLAGEIQDFWPHQLTWKLTEGAHYRADFLVMLRDGSLQIHETKGGKRSKSTGEWKPFGEEDAMLKIKLVAAQVPFPVLIAFEAGKDNWQFQEI